MAFKKKQRIAFGSSSNSNTNNGRWVKGKMSFSPTHVAEINLAKKQMMEANEGPVSGKMIFSPTHEAEINLAKEHKEEATKLVVDSCSGSKLIFGVGLDKTWFKELVSRSLKSMDSRSYRAVILEKPNYGDAAKKEANRVKCINEKILIEIVKPPLKICYRIEENEYIVAIVHGNKLGKSILAGLLRKTSEELLNSFIPTKNANLDESKKKRDKASEIIIKANFDSIRYNLQNGRKVFQCELHLLHCGLVKPHAIEYLKILLTACNVDSIESFSVQFNVGASGFRTKNAVKNLMRKLGIPFNKDITENKNRSYYTSNDSTNVRTAYFKTSAENRTILQKLQNMLRNNTSSKTDFN